MDTRGVHNCFEMSYDDGPFPFSFLFTWALHLLRFQDMCSQHFLHYPSPSSFHIFLHIVSLFQTHLSFYLLVSSRRETVPEFGRFSLEWAWISAAQTCRMAQPRASSATCFLAAHSTFYNMPLMPCFASSSVTSQSMMRSWSP